MLFRFSTNQNDIHPLMMVVPYRVRYKWDTIQREFTCCGGYGFTVGYTGT